MGFWQTRHCSAAGSPRCFRHLWAATVAGAAPPEAGPSWIVTRKGAGPLAGGDGWLPGAPIVGSAARVWTCAMTASRVGGGATAGRDGLDEGTDSVTEPNSCRMSWLTIW